MKKKLLSLVLAICLVLPCAILMTACSKKAYSISGKTFEYDANSNIKIIWKVGVSDDEKKKYLDGLETEEKAIEQYRESIKDTSITLTFNKDGSLLMKQSYKENGETKINESTFFYSQSEDKNEIKIYDKKDYTSDTESLADIMFRDGNFYLVHSGYDADAAGNCFIELTKR